MTNVENVVEYYVSRVIQSPLELELLRELSGKLKSDINYSATNIIIPTIYNIK